MICRLFSPAVWALEVVDAMVFAALKSRYVEEAII